MRIPVPSLIGGISTQPESSRPVQMAQESINTLGTVIEGLRKRPPGTLMSRLDYRMSNDAAYHDINYDDYKFLAGLDSDGSLRVWDINTGVSESVFKASGGPVQAGDVPYLAAVTPRESIKFLPLADYTLILNSEKVTAASTELHTQTRKEAVVSVVQGGYAGIYSVEVINRVSGTGGRATVRTRASDGNDQSGNPPPSQQGILAAELSAQTDKIAELLAKALSGISINVPDEAVLLYDVAALSSDYTVEFYGPNILIRNDNGDDFDVVVEESIGENSAMNLTHKEVQLFTDLPTSSPVGMKVQVIGEPESGNESYWVEFRPNDSSLDNIQGHGTWARGYWQESVAPGISKGLDPDTMPHALIRGPGGWVITPLDGVLGTGVVQTTSLTELPKWDERLVGDLKSNRDPAFVGEKIRDIGFHGGRLLLLGRGTLSMSEVREPFSFYRTSILTTLPSDRIFLNTPIQRNETLNHVASMGADVVVMSEETQYLVRSSNGSFSPSTIFVTAAGRHDADPVARPVTLNDQLFVPRTTGPYGSVSGLVVRGDQRPVLENFDITSGVPRWLPVPYQMSTSPMLDLAFLVSEYSTKVYVYAEFYNGGEKRHQSWQSWDVLGVSKIHHMWTDETNMRMLVAHQGDPEKLHVLEFNMEHNATDDGEPQMCLDFRQLLSNGTYDSATDKTTYDLDFDLVGTAARVAVTRSVKRVDGAGTIGGNVVLEGDSSSQDVWIGQPYDMEHVLSRIKDVDQQGTPVSHGSLRLDTGALQYDKTGEFNITLDDNFNNRFASYFNGTYLGQGASPSEGRLSTGVLEFPIRGRSQDLRLGITSAGTEPVRIVSLDVEARRVRGIAQR